MYTGSVGVCVPATFVRQRRRGGGGGRGPGRPGGRGGGQGRREGEASVNHTLLPPGLRQHNETRLIRQSLRICIHMYAESVDTENAPAALCMSIAG